MGRGRAKAKQTKVARELKYHSPNTDLAALQRELASNRRSDDEVDTHSDYLDEDSDEPEELDDTEDATDEGHWATHHR